MKEKSSYTIRYFLFQMGRLKTCTVFSVIFSLLGFPVLCSVQNIIDNSSKYDTMAIPLMVISIIGIMGVCAMACITPVIALRHLYTRVEADNILSLPLTANKRFLADIGSIYASFHLPFALSVLLSGVSESVTCRILDISWGGNYHQYALYGLVLVIMFCAFNSAIITCCGRIREAIIYPLLLNVVIPVCIVVGGLISFKECPGVTNAPEYEIFASPVMLISPISAFICCFYYGIYTASFYLQLGGCLIVSAIYITIAFLGYKKRRAENIGKPFVFRRTFLIFSSITALTLIFSYCYLTDYSVTEMRSASDIVILGALLLILMLIMDVINGGKIKRLWKFVVKYAATYGLGIALCFALIASKAFGAGFYVPDPEDVEFVNLSYHSWNNGYAEWDNVEAEADVRHLYGGITADDTEMFELICAEHQRIVDNSKTDSSYAENGLTIINENYLTIQYFLKNGKDVYRTYNLAEMSPEFSHAIYKSEAYRVSDLKILDLHDYYYYRNDPGVTAVEEPARLQLTNRETGYIYIDTGKQVIDEERFMEVLEKDLRADTEYGRHDEYPVGVLKFGTTHTSTDHMTGEKEEWFSTRAYFLIYDSYTNTIEFLKQYGTVPTAEQSLTDALENYNVFAISRMTMFENEYSYSEASGYGWETHDFVFLTAAEYKELASKTVTYREPLENGEKYIYQLWNVIPANQTDSFTKNEYMEALKEIGIERENYDFLSSADTYMGSFYGNDLNENFSQSYEKFFTDRRIFTFDEQQ